MSVSPSSTSVHRPFGCDECPKVFTRSENLQRHKRARHSGSLRKTFQCPACRAQFSRSDVFKRHGSRCRAGTSPNRAPQHDALWESTPHIVNTASPLATSQETNESTVVLPTDSFWDTHSLGSNELPRVFLPQSPRSHGEHNAPQLKAYFEHFHPSFPLLHHPTFSVTSTPKLLVQAATIIGSLFSANSGDPDEAQSRTQWRRDMWEDGRTELLNMISSSSTDVRQSWVIQAWLLYILYGAYANEAALFDTARQLLRQLVDTVREVGLSQQVIAMPDSQSWMCSLGFNNQADDSQTLYARWMSYIGAESMRLSLYALVFLDTYTSSLCNSRPLMSPMELGWELPFPSSLWESQNSQIWLQRFNEHFGPSAFTMADTLLHAPRGLATASLTIATQQIMTETPDLNLLVALEASPFATLFVLTNVSALSRDLTRCYYQLPSSPSDPNPFHIFTQQQNKMFHCATRAIGKIIKDQAHATHDPQFLLWRTIQLSIFSLRISLCRPDELLIGGIVDNNLLAAMATSTHLAQGNLVAIRRSVPLTPHHVGGDESILAVLNDLFIAIATILNDEPERKTCEAPWTTVASYGILLCVWGALRRAIADIRHHLGSFNQFPRTSEPCMLIFNTLMESILLESSSESSRSIRDPRLWSLDRDAFGSLLEEAESTFVNSIKGFCANRTLWGIGPSMLGILCEIPTGTNR